MSETALLEIALALLGGLNIFQFIFIKATKQKYEAEAQKATTEAKHERIDLQQDQYDYVNSQLTKIQEEYYTLADRYRATMSEHLKEIDVKCNEIAQLKSKLSYFKGLRCYRSECGKRIWDNPENNQNKNQNENSR